MVDTAMLSLMKRNCYSNINPYFLECAHRCLFVVGVNSLYCFKCDYNWNCTKCAKAFKLSRDLESKSSMTYQDALYCYYTNTKCTDCLMIIHHRYR
jgi:hypothetical protein